MTSVPRSRGASANLPNRFEALHYEPDALDLAPDEDDGSPPPLKTKFYRDLSSSFITTNTSPDVGFTASGNPYRGCEHGCAYCYARPTHEYLGFSAGLDFESKIMVKEDAPELLRKEMMARSWQPQVIVLSGVTDCYQPAERHFQITRKCLQVLAEFRNPAAIITKNHLVTRDIDVLKELAAHGAVAVNISITTLDSDLARKLEPRASLPQHRLAAIKELTAAGIPVGVMTAPIIPGLNEHEIFPIIAAAREAGACKAAYTMLRLPFGVKHIFAEWLQRHFPDRAAGVLNRIRELRGGKLNDSTFGTRMTGEGVWAEQINTMFRVACERAAFKGRDHLSIEAFRRPSDQMTLWE